MSLLRTALLEIISDEVGILEEDLKPELQLENLGLDSLEFIHLIQEIERETGIRIPDERISSLNTVGDLLEAAVG